MWGNVWMRMKYSHIPWEVLDTFRFYRFFSEIHTVWMKHIKFISGALVILSCIIISIRNSYKVQRQWSEPKPADEQHRERRWPCTCRLRTPGRHHSSGVLSSFSAADLGHIQIWKCPHQNRVGGNARATCEGNGRVEVEVSVPGKLSQWIS